MQETGLRETRSGQTLVLYKKACPLCPSRRRRVARAINSDGKIWFNQRWRGITEIIQARETKRKRAPGYREAHRKLNQAAYWKDPDKFKLRRKLYQQGLSPVQRSEQREKARLRRAQKIEEHRENWRNWYARNKEHYCDQMRKRKYEQQSLVGLKASIDSFRRGEIGVNELNQRILEAFVRVDEKINRVVELLPQFE